MKFLAGLCLFAVTASAQLVTFGVKGGVGLTEDLGASSNAAGESKPYVLGPMIVVPLPHGLSLEFDALYSRVGFREENFMRLNTFSSSTLRYRGNSWEFPILLRKKLGPVYASAGYAPRVIRGGGHGNSISQDPFTGNLSFREGSVPGPWRTTHGVVLAAGWERRWRALRVAPELRYTRWTQRAVDRFGAAQNQVQLLVGFSF